MLQCGKKVCFEDRRAYLKGHQIWDLVSETVLKLHKYFFLKYGNRPLIK